jgi:hypothetical protein
MHQQTDTQSEYQEGGAPLPDMTAGSLAAAGRVVYSHPIMGTRHHVFNEIMCLPKWERTIAVYFFQGGIDYVGHLFDHVPRQFTECMSSIVCLRTHFLHGAHWLLLTSVPHVTYPDERPT